MNKLILALAALLPFIGNQPDPADCSVCHNKPAKMAKLGVDSHSGFRFGRSDTKLVDRIFKDDVPVYPIYWIEGQHIKMGFAAADFPLWPGGDEPDRGAGKPQELRSLANGKLAMKPYARVHAYLERAEETYARVQELLKVEDADFPRLDQTGKPVQPKGAPNGYMGEGPYLGQAAKYELLFLPGPSEYGRYIKHPNGLAGEYLNQALVKDTDAMSTALHLSDGTLWDDTIVTGYMMHFLAHAMIRGYKHNSYTTPPWLDAGFAHVIEGEANPSGNSFCGDGSAAHEGGKLNNFTDEVKVRLRKNHGPYFEELVAKESLSDFTLEDHVFAWSMVRFLVEEHPRAFAQISADLKGLSKSKRPVGVIMLRHAQQDAFARNLDMTYGEFDKAWSKWAKKLRGQR